MLNILMKWNTIEYLLIIIIGNLRNYKIVNNNIYKMYILYIILNYIYINNKNSNNQKNV